MEETEFEYVVERKPPDIWCFGSRKHRNTSPIGKELSPFQKRGTPEDFPKIHPAYYDITNHTSMTRKMLLAITSKRGYGTLADAEPRFKESRALITPGPSAYAPSLSWEVVDESKFPFGSKIARKTFGDNWNPGPGIYDITGKTCRRTRFNYNFGKPSMVDTIEMYCITNPVDSCIKCKQLCEGDYWHIDYTTFLCHSCWLEEKSTHEKFKEKKLKKFNKMRNCTFFHEHEGTTAAIHLLPKNKLKKRIRLENYLDLYIKC